MPFRTQCVMLAAGGCAHKANDSPSHTARPALSEPLNSHGTLPAGITAHRPGLQKLTQRGFLHERVSTPKGASTLTMNVLFCYRLRSLYERADARRKSPATGTAGLVLRGYERCAPGRPHRGCCPLLQVRVQERGQERGKKEIQAMREFQNWPVSAASQRGWPNKNLLDKMECDRRETSPRAH